VRVPSFGRPVPVVRTYQDTVCVARAWEGDHRLMCPHTSEDYSPEEEVHKLRMEQEEEASGRREQAERWIRGERST
jgi:hypothetical protein